MSKWLGPLIALLFAVAELRAAADGSIIGAVVVHLSAVQTTKGNEAGLVGKRLGNSLAERYGSTIFSDPLYFNNQQIQVTAAQSNLALQAASGILNGIYEGIPLTNISKVVANTTLPFFPPPLKSFNETILPVALGNTELPLDFLLSPNVGVPARRAFLAGLFGGKFVDFLNNFMNPYVLTGTFDDSTCANTCCKDAVKLASTQVDASRMLSVTGCPSCLNLTTLGMMVHQTNISNGSMWGCIQTSSSEIVPEAAYPCALSLYSAFLAEQTAGSQGAPLIQATIDAFRNMQFIQNQLLYEVLPRVLNEVSQGPRCGLAPSTTPSMPAGFELPLRIMQLTEDMASSKNSEFHLFSLQADAATLLELNSVASNPPGWPASGGDGGSRSLADTLHTTILSPSSEAALLTLLKNLHATNEKEEIPFLLTPGMAIVFEVLNVTGEIRVEVQIGVSSKLHPSNFTFSQINLTCSGHDQGCAPSTLKSTLLDSLPDSLKYSSNRLQSRICLVNEAEISLIQCEPTVSAAGAACIGYRKSCPQVACCQPPSETCIFGLNAQSLACGIRLEDKLSSNKTVESLISSLREESLEAELGRKSWRNVVISMATANLVVALPLLSMIFMWCNKWHLTREAAYLDPIEEEEERVKLLSALSSPSEQQDLYTPAS